MMTTADLPGNGPLQLGPVQLPAGRQLFGQPGDAPRMWATSWPVPDAGRVWQALAGIHSDTGLVPIMLAFLDSDHEGRPWDEGDLKGRCDLPVAGGPDVGRVLAENWAIRLSDASDEGEPGLAQTTAPFGSRFPGLASAQRRPLTGIELTRALGWFGPARIGLVPATRPADVLALVGHHAVSRDKDPAPLTSVLRSWEDRFGAVLIEAGFDHLRILARRPPRALTESHAVAAELWAMCDEFWPVSKPGTALWSIGDIASHISDIPIWTLWLG